MSKLCVIGVYFWTVHYIYFRVCHMCFNSVRHCRVFYISYHTSYHSFLPKHRFLSSMLSIVRSPGNIYKHMNSVSCGNDARMRFRVHVFLELYPIIPHIAIFCYRHIHTSATLYIHIHSHKRNTIYTYPGYTIRIEILGFDNPSKLFNSSTYVYLQNSTFWPIVGGSTLRDLRDVPVIRFWTAKYIHSHKRNTIYIYIHSHKRNTIHIYIHTSATLYIYIYIHTTMTTRVFSRSFNLIELPYGSLPG